MRNPFGSISHLAPFAAVVGYVAMYWSGSKGIAQILPDIENISISNLTKNYQNLLIAAGAWVAMHFLSSFHLPAMMKNLVVVALWFLIGYELALAMDPPVPIRYSGRVMYVPPATLNPYALTSQGV